MLEVRTYFSLIDIHRNVNSYCFNLWESEWRRTPNNKLKEINNTTNYRPNPLEFNRKNELIINRLWIGHSKMSYGHFIKREGPILCQTSGELFTVKYLLTHFRTHTETRKSMKIPDNLYEALGPNEKNIKKIFYILKFNYIYDSI